MQKLPHRASWLGVFVILVSAGLCGCGRGQSSSKDSSTSNESAAPNATGGGAEAKETAKPGFITGRITRPDGSPIGISGSIYRVTIRGVSGPGENVGFNPPVTPEGTFSIHVPSGIYHQVGATVRIPFDGVLYSYSLVSTTMLNDIQSDAGIVADFVWQTTGPVPLFKDEPDPGNFTHWFGGSCGLAWDPTYLDAQRVYHNLTIPDGSKFVFTANPNGKLIDGADGKPITFDRAWKLNIISPIALNDLPPAINGWHITGKLTHPDGTTIPVLLKVGFQQGDKYASAVDVKMTPDQEGTIPPLGKALSVTLPPP